MLVAEEAEEDDEMLADWIGLNAIGAQIADWTDPRRAIGIEHAEKAAPDVDGAVHLLLASQLLGRVLTPGCSKEERKMLVAMLGKVALLGSPTRPDLLRGNLEMVDLAMEGKIAQDASMRNVLGKMETGLRRLVDALGEGPSETAVVSGGEAGDGEETATETATAAAAEEVEASGSGEVGLGGSGSDDMPEAEGTVIGNDDDEADADATVVGTTNVRSEVMPKHGGRDSLADESAVQSLLESWDSNADEDLV